MARTESESIYLDLRAFLKEARKAGYEMEARNRVDYIVPLSNALRECIRVFIRCHKERDAVRKFALVEQLDTEFTIARTEFHIADDEHVWRGKKDEYGNCKCALRMADLMAKIDDGIGRWRTSMLNGRPAPEMQ